MIIINRAVQIQLDALTLEEQAAIQETIKNADRFARTKGQYGRYPVLGKYFLIYEWSGDNIHILDVMNAGNIK